MWWSIKLYGSNLSYNDILGNPRAKHCFLVPMGFMSLPHLSASFSAFISDGCLQAVCWHNPPHSDVCCSEKSRTVVRRLLQKRGCEESMCTGHFVSCVRELEICCWLLKPKVLLMHMEKDMVLGAPQIHSQTLKKGHCCFPISAEAEKARGENQAVWVCLYWCVCSEDVGFGKLGGVHEGDEIQDIIVGKNKPFSIPYALR